MPEFDQYSAGTEAVFSLDAECVASSEKALLVKFADGSKHWIPITQIDGAHSDIFMKGDKGMIAFTPWFARQKGWIK